MQRGALSKIMRESICHGCEKLGDHYGIVNERRQLADKVPRVYVWLCVAVCSCVYVCVAVCMCNYVWLCVCVYVCVCVWLCMCMCERQRISI